MNEKEKKVGFTFILYSHNFKEKSGRNEEKSILIILLSFGLSRKIKFFL